MIDINQLQHLAVVLRDMITDSILQKEIIDQRVFCISGSAKNLTAATNLHMVIA